MPTNTSTPGAAAARPVRITGAQLATAFEGQPERRKVSIFYRIGLMAVAGLMVLLPLVYLAMIAGAIWLVGLHVTHSKAMFTHVRGRAILLVGVIYIAPIVAGAMLVLFMILPVFWRSKRDGPKPFWVDRREEPILYEYVDKLCDVMRPALARIDITAAANASAHIDNGLLGLVRRRLVLTIGLPLVRSLDLRQFTGVLAHELGHFSQGGSMRVSYVVHRINGWFARAAWGQSGIDDVLDGWVEAGDAHWGIALIALVCKGALGLARLVLKTLAIVSHGLTMNHSRQAEFDADQQAARIAGGEAIGDALQKLPIISTAFDLSRARAGWARRRLPDDLVIMTHALQKNLPPELKDAVTASILTSESSWFDSHPPLFTRVALLKTSKLKGVLRLDGPATCLFRDFDDACKMATLDTYQGLVGDLLQPEHLVPTKVDVAPKPAAAPS